MYSKFQYQSIPLCDIGLDVRNPRIVTQKPLKSEKEILQYLFDHEDLVSFIKKIVHEGKNAGAERPYIVKTGKSYTVIEGNTRIASYKVLCGELQPPKEYASAIPKASAALKKSLATVDCSIAPNRDSLLPIMASAHFGLGDKSKWGYLGSRKAVYDEWMAGKSLAQVAKAFNKTKGEITDLILEYKLYLKALGLTWTTRELDVLLDPAVQFNPPVRFLQTSGHKDKVGIEYDKANLEIVLKGSDTKAKFKHLILKLVINPEAKLGATATYDEVFKGFNSGGKPTGRGKPSPSGSNPSGGGQPNPAPSPNPAPAPGGHPSRKQYTLFNYTPKSANPVLKQLAKEAKDLNCKTYPGAGTFLLRNVIEGLLKQIIHDQQANKTGRSLDLAGAISLCLSNAVTLTTDDARILKEFNKSHLDSINLGSHGTTVPNYDRLMAARDCIDMFVMRHI